MEEEKLSREEMEEESEEFVDYTFETIQNMAAGKERTEEDRENEREFDKELSLYDDHVGSDADSETKHMVLKYECLLGGDQDEDEDEVNGPGQRAADSDALIHVLEEIIRLPASTKICHAHHVDPDILTKFLDDFKDSIAQQEKPAQQQDSIAQQQERKRKLTSHIPNSADAINNVSEEITQLPASKKIRYAHDDQEIMTKVSEE